MNAEQKERVKAVIADDATGRGDYAYIDAEGTVLYCVLGGLGHAIGLSYDDLENGGWEPRLEGEYGLSRGQRGELVEVNDDHADLMERRAALIAWVDEQPMEAA